jgi:hypothetical protein
LVKRSGYLLVAEAVCVSWFSPWGIRGKAGLSGVEFVEKAEHRRFRDIERVRYIVSGQPLPAKLGGNVGFVEQAKRRFDVDHDSSGCLPELKVSGQCRYLYMHKENVWQQLSV